MSLRKREAPPQMPRKEGGAVRQGSCKRKVRSCDPTAQSQELLRSYATIRSMFTRRQKRGCLVLCFLHGNIRTLKSNLRKLKIKILNPQWFKMCCNRTSEILQVLKAEGSVRFFQK